MRFILVVLGAKIFNVGPAIGNNGQYWPEAEEPEQGFRCDLLRISANFVLQVGPVERSSVNQPSPHRVLLDAERIGSAQSRDTHRSASTFSKAPSFLFTIFAAFDVGVGTRVGGKKLVVESAETFFRYR